MLVAVLSLGQLAIDWTCRAAPPLTDLGLRSGPLVQWWVLLVLAEIIILTVTGWP